MAFENRKPLFEKIEADRKSKVLLFVTGDRAGLETRIADDAIDHITTHMDAIGNCKKLSLILHTRGGSTIAAWTIVNILVQFCEELEIIVPTRAHSAGTLMCLAAHQIVMTKQATLGPIDPSVNGPLNPFSSRNPGGGPPVSVNTENIQAFVEFARKSANVGEKEKFSEAFTELARQVHPLVLGEASRARSLIRMLSERLLQRTLGDNPNNRKIQDFLCSESWSHEYTINRREAADLGLKIQKPGDDLYSTIQTLYKDIAKELEFHIPFDPNVILGVSDTLDYKNRRGLIESLHAGSHAFMTQGKLSRPAPDKITTQIWFEGWKYEHAIHG